ncbi:penicillin-binding transpeptidase domain-containing protein [Microlunatus panaciterrae]|uniref:Peptidoglycan glycosyltransferase n=1 Tax=Microlunatus panaciterrae TaxID=400768 RepID=A0ABS2RJ43_9ACTN|nr:penicillin-binding protein 2 [Microlunatus panaciterrae]MBM7799030.1 peptidoglycan glycosyltransferase [Microlunatus panaciterrae]
MNRPIRRVAVVVMLMFGLLFANVTFNVVFRTESLNAQPQNRRVRDAEFAQDRGSILAGTTEIATTTPVRDRFKYLRTYPQGELYAPVTGFYSYDHARSGLESSYNTQLAGTDDSLFVRRMIDLVTNRTPKGASVETTINPDAQRAAAKALGDQKGAVVAIDPQTGAILAMVTSPSYDPNKIASHDIEAAGKAYQRLATAKNHPMANRAAREIYPPGSTFKLVTAAAALEAGKTPDSKVKSPTRLKLPGTQTYLGNESNCGGQQITLQHALEVSCNTAFANLGLELGADKLRDQANKFGFDARHLSDLGGAASKFPENPDRSQTALSAIGQFDVAASPLQMAMVTAAIANDGVLMDPYIVSVVRAPDLKPLQTTKPKELSQPMTADNAKALQKMMVGVVNNGTGTTARIPGVEVGGKTGTAQSDLKRKPFAWFTSYATSGDRQVAVAVVVEDADIPRQDIAGGRVAAPIAKAVMKAVL